MAIEFTEKQKKVLNARNHNVLVSAAAGSGKTAVLVERIVREQNLFDEIHITQASCTISSHCGPNTLGVLFLTE